MRSEEEIRKQLLYLKHDLKLCGYSASENKVKGKIQALKWVLNEQKGGQDEER